MESIRCFFSVAMFFCWRRKRKNRRYILVGSWAIHIYSINSYAILSSKLTECYGTRTWWMFFRTSWLLYLICLFTGGQQADGFFKSLQGSDQQNGENLHWAVRAGTGRCTLVPEQWWVLGLWMWRASWFWSTFGGKNRLEPCGFLQYI